MEQRQLEDLRYEQVARIGKALGSPKRLELRLALDQMAAPPPANSRPWTAWR